jgi:hypothetical protein
MFGKMQTRINALDTEQLDSDLFEAGWPIIKFIVY